jgi:hypothetical protein
MKACGPSVNRQQVSLVLAMKVNILNLKCIAISVPEIDARINQHLSEEELGHAGSGWLLLRYEGLSGVIGS